MSGYQGLTCAHSYASVSGGSEVTVEAFVWVADIFLCTELPHLLGTHPAAATAVQHEAHSGGALRGGGGARALAAALLTCSLTGETHPQVNIEHMEHYSQRYTSNTLRRQSRDLCFWQN